MNAVAALEPEAKGWTATKTTGSLRFNAATFFMQMLSAPAAIRHSQKKDAVPWRDGVWPA